MKKFLLPLVSLMLITAIIGCTKNEKTKTVANETQKVTKKKAGLKIAIVTSPSGVDDGSFNEDNYNGILSFIKKNPEASVKAINEPTGDPAASVQTVADIVADYDAIVCCGFQFSGIGIIAADNPNVKFILVDTNPVNAENQTVELDNVYAMTFAEQESGFMAGMAAALESKTKKVAVINGIAYPSNVNYQYGFESGVNYANKKYNTKVQIVELPSYAGTDVTGTNVGGNYVGNFNDEATGKVVGNALLQKNVDIIFVAAGNSGNGVFTAVKENKKSKVIGCDVDQYDDGINGDQNIILTSGLKIMSTNVEKQLQAIIDNTFHGKNALLTAAEYSTGYVKAKGRQQLHDEVIQKLESTYALLQNGTIIPAANFNNQTPENFTGLNN